ncbi:hypothetical protein LC040_02895 [Bacillus tianshenii]|nr:hypothetical protein LC040_02895 [Bacillus tianshenii]
MESITFRNSSKLAELERTGCFTMKTPSREAVVVEKQMLLDFEEINQQELLQSVSCPVLIIHGDNDEEERQLLERSRRGMDYLTEDSKLIVIEGATHRFLEHMEQLTKLTREWFERYLT